MGDAAVRSHFLEVAAQGLIGGTPVALLARDRGNADAASFRRG